MARKDPISHLSRHPVALPDRLVAEIERLGEPGRLRLLELAATWAAPADPVLVSQAFAVLGRLGDRRALPLALAVYAAATTTDDLVYARAGFAIDRLVRPEDEAEVLARPTVLREAADDLADALVQCGAWSPALRERVLAAIERSPVMYAAARFPPDPELAVALRAMADREIASLERSDAPADGAIALLYALRNLGDLDTTRISALESVTRRRLGLDR